MNPATGAMQSADEDVAVKLPERVPLYMLSDFLKDPFEFRISQMLAASESDDPEKELFEPIHFEPLQKSALLKMMVAAELSHKSEELEKIPGVWGRRVQARAVQGASVGGV